MESVTQIHHTSNAFIHWKQLLGAAQFPLASPTPSLSDVVTIPLHVPRTV